jgi:hypothetical protein
MGRCFWNKAKPIGKSGRVGFEAADFGAGDDGTFHAAALKESFAKFLRYDGRFFVGFPVRSGCVFVMPLVHRTSEQNGSPTETCHLEINDIITHFGKDDGSA